MNFKKEKSVSDYRVLPRTVLCDTPARVSIIPCGKSKRFDDQTDYTVSLVPMSFYSDSYVDGSMKPETLTVRPVDGTLTVPCRLADEQEWVLSVDWEENRKRGRQPLEFHIYALREDLYRRNPYRGDLHSHSTGSDGREDPAVVAANYRREGFDFLALTDHSNWHSSEQMLQAYGDLPLGIRLFHGEEVHLGTIIHIVNFGSRYSITDHYRSNQEQCQAEMRELADRHPTPQGVNRQEYAMRLWIVEQIRRAGGMGRNSMERKEHPEICQKARFPHRFIRRVGMPGQGRIAILKIAVADQIRLSSGILFRRAAIIADRSRKLLLLHIRL